MVDVFVDVAIATNQCVPLPASAAGRSANGYLYNILIKLSN